MEAQTRSSGARREVDLPIRLAIRLVLDSVSYSNPLPEWFEPLTINYLRREQVIAKKIEGYIRGELPKQPFAIMVPKKHGGFNRWLTPSVNDQIVIQACVSAMARRIDQSLDKKKIYSCRLNSDPNRLALMEDQVSAWRAFGIETRTRCAEDRCVLQIDLEGAFPSINRSDFFNYLRHFSTSGPEGFVLQSLLNVFSGDQPGLPMINDSVFFLGNAYLTKVDRVLDRYTTNYIRFVDDYRIFGSTKRELEGLLRILTVELGKIGFRVNPQKLRLGTGSEYLEAISQVKYAVTGERENYIDAAVLPDVIPAQDMISLVEKSVLSPADYLHQGFGRLLMASLRRMRHNSDITDTKDLFSSPRDEFCELLVSHNSILESMMRLLTAYSRDPQESWRSVWLLYLAQDLEYWKTNNTPMSNTLLRLIRNSLAPSSLDPVVRLWAKGETNATSERRPLDVERLHEAGYLEGGALWLGA